MSDDDPFAEPSDTERTVIRPNPGGRRPTVAPAGAPVDAAPQQATAQPVAAPSQADKLVMEAGFTGMNPLNAAATSLFALISRIRNRAQHNDPEAMRQAVVAEIRGFESRAIAAQVDPRQVKVARYAISATVDDVVLNTPWGSNSTWAQKSMVSTFHREVVGGDRFYDVLAGLEKEPGTNIDLLEFIYVCLSLGFEGRLRVEEGGQSRHMEVRAGLAEIIRNHRGPLESDLSPHWRGVDKVHREVSFWRPFWITIGVLAGILGLTFGAFSTILKTDRQALITQMASIMPGEIPSLGERAPFQAPTPPVVVNQIETMEGFLKVEIDAGLVSVNREGNTITIRVNGDGLFASASDQITERYLEPVRKVGRALNTQYGAVVIVGNTDSDRLRSRRYADNMELSIARANAVLREIQGVIDDPNRLTAEGRGASNPLVPNNSRTNKAKNRRVEVVLIQEDDV